MTDSLDADIILKEISALMKKYSGDVSFDDPYKLLASEEKVISLMSDHLDNKKSKVELLDICEKVFTTDLSKLSKDKQRFFNYMR